MKIHTLVVDFSATRLMMMMIMSSGVLLDWDSHNYDFDDYDDYDDDFNDCDEYFGDNGDYDDIDDFQLWYCPNSSKIGLI